MGRALCSVVGSGVMEPTECEIGTSDCVDLWSTRIVMRVNDAGCRTLTSFGDFYTVRDEMKTYELCVCLCECAFAKKCTQLAAQVHCPSTRCAQLRRTFQDKTKKKR